MKSTASNFVCLQICMYANGLHKCLEGIIAYLHISTFAGFV